MFDLQDILHFYTALKNGFDFLAPSPAVVMIFSALFGGCWWLYKQKRKSLFSSSTNPFQVLLPHSDILKEILAPDNDTPLADNRIPYQERMAGGNIKQELLAKLAEECWLLIVGKTGIGKTREATEVAQILNNEGWRILWLKWGVWLDEPKPEALAEIGTPRKLLFFLDDLNNKIAWEPKNPKAAELSLEPLRKPLQERLLGYLTAYENKCGITEIRVIATTRNEPQEWEKLQWDKYKQFWERFQVYELPKPEDKAIVGLLRDTIPKTNISAQEEDYEIIAGRNDRTFRNVVENLIRLENRGLSLTLDNYQETLTANWKKRYEDAIQKYPVALSVYQAVDLLRRSGIIMEKFTVQPTARLIVGGSFWQKFCWRRQISRVLDYLVESEGILQPRDGQIEALGHNSVQLEDYWESLFRLVLQLTKQQKEKMLPSLFNFGVVIAELEHYPETVKCWDKILALKPDYHEAWSNRGVALGNLGKLEEAIASFNKAIKLKPDEHQAWLNRGVALDNLGKSKEAIDSFDKAIELKPDYHPAWSNRGFALRNLGKLEEAIASFNKAIKLKPDEHQAW
ncbi:MAG: tetratricopeptide repeat protein, partial [Prochloron sp. SP5CPC1]|nr:tetratricopeptide repeat protein [Candidatus Paraprochloron terpiosi SP5CPC1]